MQTKFFENKRIYFYDDEIMTKSMTRKPKHPERKKTQKFSMFPPVFFSFHSSEYFFSLTPEQKKLHLQPKYHTIFWLLSLTAFRLFFLPTDHFLF